MTKDGKDIKDGPLPSLLSLKSFKSPISSP